MSYYIPLYIEVNIISLVIVAIMMRKSYGANQMKSYGTFFKAVLFMCIFIISDTIVKAMINIEGFGSPFWIMLFKSIYFMSCTIMCFFWLMYFEAKGDTFISKKKSTQYKISCLVWLQLALTIVNLFYPIFFYVDEVGAYHRGSLFILQYIFAYIYVTSAIIHGLYYSLANTNYIDRGYVFTLIFFPILPALSGIVQFFFPWLPVSGFCLTISAMVLYLNNIEEMLSLDALTGLRNRRNFMRIISNKMKNYDEAHDLFLLMVDVDYFKQINDQFGHVEGDQALVTVAKALTVGTARLGNKVNIGRFGGDEFIIIMEAVDETQVREAIENILNVALKLSNELNTPYKLGLSIGYARYVKDCKMVTDFIDKADEHLYAVKEARHRSMAR